MITNNKSIKNYDFYHPNNIFVTDYENFEGLEDFMENTFKIIPDELKSKYCFDNWIKYILDLEDYEPINLPK